MVLRYKKSRAREGAAFCVLNGAGTRNRTADLLITNQLLYRLSYPGMPGLRGARHSSRTPRAGKQESRFLFDASQFAGVPLLLLHLHATQNLNALGLRAAGPMHGLGEITDRIAAQSHVLDQAQDACPVFH